MTTDKAFIIILGLLIGLSPLAIDMYLPSMPAIASGLDTSTELVQQSLTVFLIGFSLPQLIFGPLSDAMGRRFVIIIGALLFILGSVFCALATDIHWLLMARAVQAAGAAAMAVTVPALVRDRFAGAEFARTMGVIMMVMAVAPLIAPMLGALVLVVGGWRLIFWVLVLIALIGLALFYRKVDETLATAQRTPLRPAALVRNYGMLLRDRHALLHMLSAGFMFAGMMAFVAASPFVYIELFGVAEQYYGLLFSLNIIALMALTTLANRFTHLSSKRVLQVTFALISLVCGLLILLSTVAEPPLALIVLASVLFVGTYGIISAHTLSEVMNRFARISGSTSALGGALRFGVGSLGGAAVGLFHSGTSVPMTSVMALCGILAVISFLCAGKPAAQQIDTAAQTLDEAA
ncbi:Bcr/CflA family multidrug efflux MFS transporter [Marinobacterium rhizophilum]|uniref:Bcr/CflA family efflux transporter n=1 Tax=Marinobacterium rhizophilum TaxID=420402 RepID=A0ABY5HJR3_9GAMM|nr:Bcr/CflA family multidrug efflux MFS transporter [Marinobacterium rhizophilum]UTW11823.1 Bcr/CflA family multidrug efflux MFS transporter [Marinobacterium rhizophilum]